MIVQMRLTILCLFLCLPVGRMSAQTAADSMLRQIDSLYSAGSYSSAELEARRFLENDLLSDSLRVAGEQWVAFSLVAEGKSALAKEHFLAILRRRPSHELDPVLTSPKILAVFNDARATYLAMRAQEADGASLPVDGKAGGVTFRTIVFPGWEQWYHGRNTIGPLFAGTGLLTLGSGFAMVFLRKSAHEAYLAATLPEEIQSKYDKYNRYAKAEGYCFAAFAVVYLLSEIDVFLHDSPVSVSPAPESTPVAGDGLKIMLSLP